MSVHRLGRQRPAAKHAEDLGVARDLRTSAPYQASQGEQPAQVLFQDIHGRPGPAPKPGPMLIGTHDFPHHPVCHPRGPHRTTPGTTRPLPGPMVHSEEVWHAHQIRRIDPTHPLRRNAHRRQLGPVIGDDDVPGQAASRPGVVQAAGEADASAAVSEGAYRAWTATAVSSARRTNATAVRAACAASAATKSTRVAR